MFCSKNQATNLGVGSSNLSGRATGLHEAIDTDLIRATRASQTTKRLWILTLLPRWAVDGSGVGRLPSRMLRDSNMPGAHDAPASKATHRRAGGKKGSARTVLERPPQPQGWNTTDEDEVAVRRWRGSTEISEIEAVDSRHPVFGTFQIGRAHV